MVNYEIDLRELLKSTEGGISELETLLRSLSVNRRVELALNDIMMVMQDLRTYLEDEALLAPQKFRFDQHLVKLLDSIRYNDFGQNNNKTLSLIDIQCGLLFKIVEKMNALTLAKKRTG